ncbi:hypothetical protein BDZ45DRAFT_791379 [Acephala macrosclerotiorum]|nr:hypothetical protein BDZ45DRAFT_791379 [Acephala macrosclerotiorum]
MEGCTWAAQDNSLGISTGLVAEPQLQVASAVQMQTAVTEDSTDEQHWRQGVAKLENRIGRLETLIESLQNQIEEKTRFFAEVENYIKQLVDWTKYSKVAIESLVAELKEAVKSAS